MNETKKPNEQYQVLLETILEFTKTNFISIIWIITIYALAFRFIGITSIITLILALAYAFSPISENVYATLRGIRLLETIQDKERLELIFNEVYLQSKAKTPWLKVNIYILNRMDITVQAYGSRTIIVSQGALEVYNQIQLKGLLAHEFGRIASGHTKAILFNSIANKTLFIVTLLIQLIYSVYELIIMVTAYLLAAPLFGLFAVIIILFTMVFALVVWFIVNIVNIILMINSRSNELIADQYACDIGYDEELISALYLIRQMSMEKKSLFKRLKTADPHINKRITLLEA